MGGFGYFRARRCIWSTAATLMIMLGSAAVGASAQMTIDEAIYGEACGRDKAADVTELVAEMCDGQGSCDYRIDHNLLGDPAPGCPKDFKVRWSCSGAETVYVAMVGAEAGLGKVIGLMCPGAGNGPQQSAERLPQDGGPIPGGEAAQPGDPLAGPENE